MITICLCFHFLKVAFKIQSLRLNFSSWYQVLFRSSLATCVRPRPGNLLIAPSNFYKQKSIELLTSPPPSSPPGPPGGWSSIRYFFIKCISGVLTFLYFTTPLSSNHPDNQICRIDI